MRRILARGPTRGTASGACRACPHRWAPPTDMHFASAPYSKIPAMRRQSALAVRPLVISRRHNQSPRLPGNARMQVFVFDLLQYAEHLDHLRVNGQLPQPLEKRYFKSEVAVRTYREHLDAWVELERMGFDGVAFNEHHV